MIGNAIRKSLFTNKSLFTGDNIPLVDLKSEFQHFKIGVL